MHRVGIGGGMHRDRLDAHFVAGAVDAQRDLAAVGDQDASRWPWSWPYSITTSGWSNSTGWPFSTRIAVTVPAGRGDRVHHLHRLDDQQACRPPSPDGRPDERRSAGLGAR
jgi:hypothetical protein